MGSNCPGRVLSRRAAPPNRIRLVRLAVSIQKRRRILVHFAVISNAGPIGLILCCAVKRSAHHPACIPSRLLLQPAPPPANLLRTPQSPSLLSLHPPEDLHSLVCSTTLVSPSLSPFGQILEASRCWNKRRRPSSFDLPSAPSIFSSGTHHPRDKPPHPRHQDDTSPTPNPLLSSASFGQHQADCPKSHPESPEPRLF